MVTSDLHNTYTLLKEYLLNMNNKNMWNTNKIYVMLQVQQVKLKLYNGRVG